MFSLWGIIALFLTINSSQGSEIINGKEVKPHSLPYMALLESSRPVCGGILIDPNWVLTAAHCKGIKTVLLGVHSIKKKEKEKKYRQVRKVKKSVPHLKYDNKTKVNDLMLLKLDEPVKETSWVKVHQLSNVKEPADRSYCLVAGWGKTSKKSKAMSDVLMSAKVAVIDRKKCNSPEHYNNTPHITKDMICAGPTGKKRDADTCKGDSGGPIFCNGVLVGVTSFGGSKTEPCGSVKWPGVYTFLSKYHLSWIKATMKTSETEKVF